MDFAIPAEHRAKIKESKKRGKYLDFAREPKITIEHEGDNNANHKRCAQNNPLMFGKGTRRLRNQRTRRKHLDYSIIMINQNIEKSLEDLGRFALTQTPMKDH